MFYSCVRGRRQVGVDPIHGTPEYEYKVNESARHQRESIMPWNCGKKGRYFEPKGKP
jgi:hypothetical protein